MKQSCDGSRGRAHFKSRNARLGVVLIAASWLLWIPLPILPFLDYTGFGPGRIAIALLLSSQVLFWIGVVRVGPRAKEILQGWRSSRITKTRHNPPAAEA